MNAATEFTAIHRLVAAGTVRPVVDTTYRLAELPQALERFRTSRLFGKLVVLP